MLYIYYSIIYTVYIYSYKNIYCMYYSLVAMLPSTTGNLKIIYADRLTSIGMLWVATQATISNLRRWGGFLMTFSADPYFDTFLVYAVRNVVFFVSYSHHVFLFTGDV